MGSSGGNRYKWLIELLAYWQGQINSQDLCLAYGISVTQSKKYLVEYNEIHPQNLKYNRSAKAHLAQELFTFNYINGDVAEYLDWLNSQVNLADVPKSNSITHAELRLPPRAISPQIMRGLVNAVKQKRRIDVEYLSLSKTTAEGRVIQPHTFVKTGLRWHLRGYCEYRGDFRDFVLSRFRGVPEVMDSATHLREQDPGWNSMVMLRFQPDPRFTPEQKAIIEQDYQMQNGELIISTKAALAQYLIQEMQVRTDSLAKTPQQQQLILVNEEDLKPWLFTG